MENNAPRKWQIRGVVVLIFLLGFLAGALTLNLYHKQRLATFSQARQGRFDLVLEQLNLTAEQRTQVNQILTEMRQKLIELRQQEAPRFAEIRQQTNARLQQVLTPEQWQQWQQKTNEMRQRRRPER